jgi:hypothetical protein
LPTSSAAADGFAEMCKRAGMGHDQTQDAFRVAGDQIQKGLAAYESQIERMMLPWLVYRYYGDQSSYPARVHIPKTDTEVPKTATIIVPQFAIAKYRLDFALIGRFEGHMKIIAVECDGAEFHDVRDDRQRDAYLASLGIETVRVRGKEINAHNVAVAFEAAQKLAEWRFILNTAINGGSPK